MKQVLSRGRGLWDRIIGFEQKIMKYFSLTFTVIIVNGCGVFWLMYYNIVTSDLVYLVLVLDIILLIFLTFVYVQYNIYKAMVGRFTAPVVKVVDHAHTANIVGKLLFKKWPTD